MAHRPYPSFFKILLDPSARHLPLPPDFVRNHLKNKTLKDLIIRSAKGGYSWRLKIKKIGESFCLSSGWDSVVQDIQLGFGDFLVFRVLDESLFKMMVYSPNGCEKDFPPKSHVDNVVVDHDDDHIEDVDDDVVVEDVGDDDDVEDDDDDDVVVDDDVDVVVEDVDDDNEEEDEFDDEDEEEEEDDDNDEEGYEELEDDDDNDEEEDDDDNDEEGYEELEDDVDDVDDVDGDGDGDGNGDIDIDGHDGDPFSMIKITKSHKTKMRLPADFVELAGIEGEGALTAANVDGKEWELGVRVDKYSCYLSAGWRDFRRSNDLCEGDECVFKFIRNEDKLLLARVTKNKRPAKYPFGEKPSWIRDLKRNRRGRPCSRPIRSRPARRK